ncbi:hypothetical protein GQ53DRAFT_735946 [Thozetella sp. PMI_491]|nr:hypothetical protein GQ53DRAFT_735946 [Thozetella sp. PMI_491]
MSSGEQSVKATKRQSKSCKRCLKRKQRCHGFPVCTRCEEANWPCEQSEYALQLHSHDSSYAALKRIQALEAQLASALGELADGTITQSHAGPADGPCSTGTTLGDDIVPSARAVEASYTMAPTMDRSSQESSVEQIAQATVWAKALSSAGYNVSTPSRQPDFQSRSVHPPTDLAGRQMLEAYFEKIHPRYPFLQKLELLRLHTRRYEPLSSTPHDRFGAFKLNLVYAIGATLLKLTEPYSETQAEGFFAVALQHVSSARQSHTLHSIEAMALLVLYSLRSPTNAGIWYMIGLAMRTCIDLGLHLEASYAVEPPFQSERKRRLFWSVYLLERIIALSLRRPFSIAESDIDTREPSEVEEPLTEDAMEANAHAGLSRLSPNTKLTMWTKFVQIKRFESRIQSEVYRLDKTRQQRFGKIGPLLATLDAWSQSLPALTESENHYLQLQWNKAVSQLLRPFLSMMHHDSPLILRCLKASGRVCDIFKRMHQRDSYGHSFISAHSTFIAGVTMCYCLFLSPKLFNNTVANSLRACSSTMFVIAERSPALRKHRDILEDIIGRIIDSPMSLGLSQGDLDNSQGQQFSHHDSIAVQSLLNLAAQQEPQEISELNSQQRPDIWPHQGPITLPSTVRDSASASFIPAQQAGIEQAAHFPTALSNIDYGQGRKRKRQRTPAPGPTDKGLDFYFHSSWDVDSYSLEMLDRMAGPDSRN